MASDLTSNDKPSNRFLPRNPATPVLPAFTLNVFPCSPTSRHTIRPIRPVRASHSSTNPRPPAPPQPITRSSSKLPPVTNPQLDRQAFLRIMACVSLSMLPFPAPTLAEPQFSTYKGPLSLGFTFSYPSSWTVTKKAIKTHLSEVIVKSNDDASTTAGLVVDAVKIDSIDSFGTPQVVGQKVVDVEKKKDSVNDASVNSANAIQNDGLTYYVIDYTVDSSRGQKRYIAKVTVTGNQLYVFTAQAKIDNFQGETADLFTTMLDSFTVKKQYS